jgi:methionyl-tRNA synthetase
VKTVVTAALPYANGELHLGHIKSTYLPADVYVRFLKLIGRRVIYLCATDEHGTPILLKSEKKKVDPEDYVKTWRTRHLKDLQFLLVEFDKFYATHSPEHIELTQEIYRKLSAAGHTYRAKVKQYWCPNEDRPLPDRYVVGVCPHCGAKEQYGDQCEKCGKALQGGTLLNPTCKLCGVPAEIREGEHIFFRLSSFSDRLAKFVTSVKAPKSIKNFVTGWMREGLKDWDIERDISWGVSIPDSEGVFYVWFDAPIAYLSTLAKWCAEQREDFDEWWSSRVVHFIGKDIAYHHFLFWPAILMGSGYHLPDEIPVRGHLTLEGKKFSKSRNWYISIAQWRKAKLDPEYLRFYMIFTTRMGMRDSDFSATEFQKVVNEELVNNFGNLLQRVLKFAERFSSKIPDVPMDTIFNKVEKAHEDYQKLMLDGKLSEALRLACSLTHEFNVYFQEEEPWKNEEAAPRVVRTVASAVKIVNEMLYPVLPGKSQEVAQLLNVRLKWDEKSLKPGHKLKKARIVFPRIDAAGLEKLNALYKKH